MTLIVLDICKIRFIIFVKKVFCGQFSEFYTTNISLANTWRDADKHRPEFPE